ERCGEVNDFAAHLVICQETDVSSVTVDRIHHGLGVFSWDQLIRDVELARDFLQHVRNRTRMLARLGIARALHWIPTQENSAQSARGRKVSLCVGRHRARRCNRAKSPYRDGKGNPPGRRHNRHRVIIDACFDRRSYTASASLSVAVSWIPDESQFLAPI